MRVQTSILPAAIFYVVAIATFADEPGKVRISDKGDVAASDRKSAASGDEGFDYLDRYVRNRQNGIEALSHLVWLRTGVIQMELRLTTEQNAEIERMRQALDAIIKNLADNFYNSTREERESHPIRDRIHEAAAPFLPRIYAVVTPKQRKRLEQIQNRAVGLQLFYEDKIYKILNISIAQKLSIQRMLEENERATEVPDELAVPRPVTQEREAAFKAYNEEVRKTEKKSLNRIMKTLTREQRKRLDDQIGCPIDEQRLWEQVQKSAILVEVESPPGINPHKYESMTIQ